MHQYINLFSIQYKSSCLIYVVCVCLRIVVSNTYCVVFFFSLRILYPVLPVSLDYLFLNAPWEFFVKLYHADTSLSEVEWLIYWCNTCTTNSRCILTNVTKIQHPPQYQEDLLSILISCWWTFKDCLFIETHCSIHM